MEWLELQDLLEVKDQEVTEACLEQEERLELKGLTDLQATKDHRDPQVQ